MILTKEQQALLDGEKGETMAKVMKTLVMYGEAFNAEKMVPVTGEYGHTVISFGIGVMKPVYELYDKLLSASADLLTKTYRLPFCRTLCSNLCTASRNAMRNSSASLAS